METTLPNLSTSSCRICLQDGAIYPIFEDSTNHNIHSQLNKCFVEKLEDLQGYPRNICSSCKIVLDMLCDFIDKYKESCKILEEIIVHVKTEVECSLVHFTDKDDDFLWQEEEKCKEIKVENNIQNKDINNPSVIIEKCKPLPGLEMTKVKSQKCNEKKSKKSNRKKRNREIAFSILESELEWKGEKWCLKKESSKVKDKRPFKQKGKIKIQIKNKEKDQRKIDKQKHPVLCDYCGAVFKIKNKLRDHIEAHHINVPITCKICSKTYPSETRLKEHTRRFHGDMIFKCEHCPSMFATRSVLNAHVKNVHNKHLIPKKSYSCKFCDKKYKCPASIVVHERTVHTGLLPCVCKVCDRAFSHDMYLRQHMRVHTGELPFQCPICQRGYTQLSNMKSHLRIHKMSELNEDVMKKINPNYLKLLKNC